MARPKKLQNPQTLAELEAQEEELRAQLEALKEQREEIQASEIEVMSEIVGRVYVEQARADQDKWRQLVADMDLALRKKADRALFGLPPLPRKPRSKKMP